MSKCLAHSHCVCCCYWVTACQKECGIMRIFIISNGLSKVACIHLLVKKVFLSSLNVQSSVFPVSLWYISIWFSSKSWRSSLSEWCAILGSREFNKNGVNSVNIPNPFCVHVCACLYVVLSFFWVKYGRIEGVLTGHKNGYYYYYSKKLIYFVTTENKKFKTWFIIALRLSREPVQTQTRQ